MPAPSWLDFEIAFSPDGRYAYYSNVAITFSVTVMDNAANPLATFGHFGNFDAQGPGSAEPDPPIPLGWPTNVGVVGDAVYVADVLNHRLVRVDLEFEAQVELALP